MSQVEASIHAVAGLVATLAIPSALIGMRDGLFHRFLTPLATVEGTPALERHLSIGFPDEALTWETVRSAAPLRDTSSRLGAAP